MGVHTISVLCLVLYAAQVAFGEVWEFGRINTPGSLKVVHKEGHMGLFEHTKKIKLIVSKIVYKAQEYRLWSYEVKDGVLITYMLVESVINSSEGWRKSVCLFNSQVMSKSGPLAVLRITSELRILIKSEFLGIYFVSSWAADITELRSENY